MLKTVKIRRSSYNRPPYSQHLISSVLRVLPSICLVVFLLDLLPRETQAQSSQTTEGPLFIDAVVASVNGAPITLSDISKRTGIEAPSSLTEASRNDAIQMALQQIITERLLRAEAEERRLSVSKEELERYIQRVAEQNNMTLPEFEEALKTENRSMSEYRQQIEIDILRTKLANSLMRDGITVGKKEIDEYLSKTPELKSQGAKLKLRQIVIFKESMPEERARELLTQARDQTSSLEDFAELARKMSQGPEAPEGGLLGVLSEEDLHGPIFDALFKLNENAISDIIETEQGFHIFFIESRFVEGQNGKERKRLREEARTQLERQKMDDKLRLYFAEELTKKFAVDKKI